MECFLLFVVLVVGVMVLIGLAALAQSRADRWNRSWQALAQRFRGTCTPAGWFGRPSCRFRYGETQVLVNTLKQGGAGYTQVFINWPDAETRLEVLPQDAADRPAAMRGVVQSPLGTEEFQANYAVRWSDAVEAGRLLSEGAQWQIDRLRRFLNVDDIYISIHRGRLLVRKWSMLVKLEELDELVQLAMELFDQLMLTRMVGIEFMEEGAQLIQEAICQVCGEDITTDMVFCRRCKTPHHLECWQYYGSCTTYGCQETRWITPRTAGPQ